MAATIIERPYEISFSRNPIRYGLRTDTSLSTAGLRIDVRLNFRAFRGAFYEVLFEVPLTPDENGRVDIDLNKILDSLVNYELPVITDIVSSKAFNQIGQFYISYRQITTAAPNPAWTVDNANVCCVIKGGLPYQLWKGGNYFINYASAFKPLLTWQKSGRKIGPSELSWLTYLHLTANTTNASAKVDIYYTDGTSSAGAVTVTFPETNVYKYGLYRIPVGITQLALTAINPLKTIHYYGIRIVNATETLKEAYYIYPDYRNNYNTTQFNYFNSLGGFDSVRILGDISREARYESEIAETTVEASYYNENELVPMQFTQQVTEQILFKGSAGLMDDDYEMDVLRDLRISKGIYEAKYDRWWLVNMVNTPVNLGSNADPIKDFPIEWTYGIVNENYAPDINIGELPACPIVTGLSYTAPTLSWTGSGSHVSYIVEVTEYLISGFPPAISYIYTAVTSVTIASAIWDRTVTVRAVCASSQSEPVGTFL